MVVTDYCKKRTIGNVQKEGTMEFPIEWLCCTGKRSCESRSCDRISTYQSRKEEKCGPSVQECNSQGGTTGIREGNGVAVVDWGRMCTARDKAGDLHVIASGVYDGDSGWVLERKRHEWKGVARRMPRHSAVGAREETCKRQPKREITLSSLAEAAVVAVHVGVL